jgi:hypothetical protein
MTAALTRHVLGMLWAVLLMCSQPAMAQPGALWRDDVPDARMVGQGEMRWMGFHLYTAQLWSADVRIGEREPFALVLNYQRSISRKQLVDASLKEMQRLADTPADDKRLARWRGYMDQAFRDVNEGDQLIGVYLPGKGSRFYQRSALLAEIDDAEFARAFFAIWLAPNTREPDLRRQLLGGAS